MTDNTTDPTREALAEIIADHCVSFTVNRYGPGLFTTVPPGEIVDAILASGLVVTTAEADRREREAWDAGFNSGFDSILADKAIDNPMVEYRINPFALPTTESEADRG